MIGFRCCHSTQPDILSESEEAFHSRRYRKILAQLLTHQLTWLHTDVSLRTLSLLNWRTPLTFWRPKILKPRKSFRGPSVILMSHPKVQTCALWYTVGFWLSYTSVSLFNSSIFFWVFRAADQPPELLRKPLQSYQHHQPLEHGQPQGAGGQEEEEEELGEETLVTD